MEFSGVTLLLLEPALRLLTRALLLAELLLRRSERSGLLRQVSPQLLSQLGLLLGLDLLQPCPLVGGAVLLKLGLRHGEGHLLLRRCRSAPQPGRIAPYADHRSPPQVPRPSPGARPSPGRPQKRPSWSGHAGPIVHPARPSAGTPTSRCPSVGPPQGRRGHRTAPGTGRAPSSTGRDGRISLEPGPPAPANSSPRYGRKVRSRNTRT
jgi:hypothetical protein